MSGYSPGHPWAFLQHCCGVSAIHWGAQEEPGLQTGAERGGARRPHLPWLACPLGPKPQQSRGSPPSEIPPAFVCSSFPSCSIQQTRDDLPSPAQASEAPLRPTVKGQPARAASYQPISRPCSSWLGDKKGGGPGSAGSPRPRTQKGG